DEDDPPSFTSVDARAEAALAAFEAVIAQYPSSDAAVWAHLGAGDALLELERFDDAREAFDAAVAKGGDDSTVVWRALERKGFTHEAEENWAQAVETYQELAGVDERRYEPVAKYHLARMHLAR